MLRAITIVLARIYAVTLFLSSFRIVVLSFPQFLDLFKDSELRTYAIISTGYEIVLVLIAVLIWFGAPRLVRHLHPGPLPDDAELVDAESIITAGTFLIGLFIFANSLGLTLQFFSSIGESIMVNTDQLLYALSGPVLGIILMSFSGVLGDILRAIRERTRKLGLGEDEA